MKRLSWAALNPSWTLGYKRMRDFIPGSSGLQRSPRYLESAVETKDVPIRAYRRICPSRGPKGQTLYKKFDLLQSARFSEGFPERKKPAGGQRAVWPPLSVSLCLSPAEVYTVCTCKTQGFMCMIPCTVCKTFCPCCCDTGTNLSSVDTKPALQHSLRPCIDI